MRSNSVDLGPIPQHTPNQFIYSRERSIMVDGFMYCPRANRTPFVGLMDI